MAQEVYKNQQRTSPRNGILKAQAVLKVAQVLQKYGVNELQEVVKVINHPEFEAEFRSIPGQGSGISLRYFYMLTGVETQIKPDRKILRFVGKALNRPVKVDESYTLIIAVCDKLKSAYPALTPRNLDSAIWDFQRTQK